MAHDDPKSSGAKYFVDLFAGCGGLSLGLENVGFQPVFVNELNRDALASYHRNRKDSDPLLGDSRFHCQDVKELVSTSRIATLTKDLRREFGVNVKAGELSLLVGGPPCQGFSGIGHRRSYSVQKEQLPSNQLYQDMAWVVAQLKPKIFLFENVKGLLSAKWNGGEDHYKGEIWEDVRRTFASIPEYRVNWSLVLAKNYGVPQNRPRVLLVGVRNDVDITPWEEINSGIGGGFLPTPTNNPPDLIDLLGDLVDPAYENGGKTSTYPSQATNAVQEWFRLSKDGSRVAGKGDPVSEQDYTGHSAKVLEKFRYMLEHNGEIPAQFKTKKFAQRLLPKVWGPSGPSITATSLADDYVHFSQPRILTVREWARLQGFPDWYEFAGSRTTGGLRRAGNPREGNFDRELPKYTQIGNAVPVKLAEAVGGHFLKIL